MKVLLIIFALTLPFSNVYARQYGSKQDTLVDVFPLSVNRKWIYHTENFFINNEANGYYISDSGSAAIKITTETEMTDSTVWFFEEHQNFLHREGFLGGRVDTTYKVLNVVIFQLIELHDSLHQVLIRGNSSAFRWTSDYFIPETSRVYRYREVDTLGEVRTYQNNFPYAEYANLYVFKKLVGLAIGHQAGGSIFASHSNDQRLLDTTFIETEVKPESQNLPKSFMVHQNFPNPFNSMTTIDYELPDRENISLRVYDILGREVRTLVSELREPGVYRAYFDAGDLSSGVYIYTLQTQNYQIKRQMILLK